MDILLGCAINLNGDCSLNGFGGGSPSQSYVYGYSAFTIDTRTGPSIT